MSINKDFDIYSKLSGEFSVDIRQFDLTIDSVEPIENSQDQTVCFTQFWLYSDDELLDFKINKSSDSYTLICDGLEPEEYYFDDWCDMDGDTFDIDDVEIEDDIREVYLQECKDYFSYEEIFEYLDETPPSSKKLRRDLYAWAKEQEKEDLQSYEDSKNERVNADFYVDIKEKIKIKIGKSVDARFQFDKGFVMFSIGGDGTHIHMKAHGLKLKLQELSEDGAIVYDAYAEGNDIDWWAPRARCVSNISKGTAMELIKWSDYSFGVWCDEDRVPALVYPQ